MMGCPIVQIIIAVAILSSLILAISSTEWEALRISTNLDLAYPFLQKECLLQNFKNTVNVSGYPQLVVSSSPTVDFTLPSCLRGNGLSSNSSNYHTLYGALFNMISTVIQSKSFTMELWFRTNITVIREVNQYNPNYEHTIATFSNPVGSICPYSFKVC